MKRIANTCLLLVYVALVFFAIVGSARCEDSYELYKLPKGTPTYVQGERYQAFTLDEYKLALSLDAKLKAADATIPKQIKEIEKLRLAISALVAISDLDKLALSTAMEALSHKDKALEEAVELSTTLERKLTVRKKLLRFGGTAVLALIGGLTLGILLK